MLKLSRYFLLFLAGVALGVGVPRLVGLIKGKAPFVPSALFSRDAWRKEWAKNASMVESKYFNVIEWKMDGITYLLAAEKGDPRGETAVKISTSPDRMQIKECNIIDKNKASVDVEIGVTGALARIDIYKRNGADGIVASDIGAKGSYDVLIDGEDATVLKDGRTLKGSLVNENIVVERDGMKYEVRVIDEVELIPIK